MRMATDILGQEKACTEIELAMVAGSPILEISEGLKSDACFPNPTEVAQVRQAAQRILTACVEEWKQS